MNLRRCAAIGVALLVATGCGGGDDGGGLSDSAASRRPMPSCGSFEAVPGELPAADRTVRDCFLAAYGTGTEKEVTVTASTLEGDAVVTIYRVLGPNDVEVFVDASADKFAAVKSYHQRCTGVVEDGNGLTVSGCVNLA